MKGYCDMKAMKRSGHRFGMGGFTGSAMPDDSVTVSAHMRKPKAPSVAAVAAPPKLGPSKPDFKRRALTPGGLASGGTPKSSTEVIVNAGKYASGGKPKGGQPPTRLDKKVAPKAMAHPDVAQDKALIKSELAKRGLKRGGLAAYSSKPVIAQKK